MGLFFIEISYFAKATTQYTVLSPRSGTPNENPYIQGRWMILQELLIMRIFVLYLFIYKLIEFWRNILSHCARDHLNLRLKNLIFYLFLFFKSSWCNSSYSSNHPSAKQLARQGIEQILSPKQQQRPLPCILSLSLLNDLRTPNTNPYCTMYSTVQV